MNAVFVGVVSIGLYCLQALLESDLPVSGIFTADKQKMTELSGMHHSYFSDFSGIASRWGIPLYKQDDISSPLNVETIRGLNPDIIFCIGWPQLVGKAILSIPRQGCIGIHPTLLPQRRGGAPVNWSLIDGLTESGVTLFYFEPGVDSGDIIAQKKLSIAFEDTAETLLEKITSAAVDLVTENAPHLARGTAPRTPQDDGKATYTRRRTPRDGLIDWRKTTLGVYNWIRALTLPFPGAFTTWQQKKVIIWEATPPVGYRAPHNAVPGEILDTVPGSGIAVATGDNCILIKTLTIDDEQMLAEEFVKRYAVVPGTRLGVI